MSQALIFEETDFDGIFDNEFRKIIYYTKTVAKDVELEYDSCSFYYKPFLKMDSHQFLVLNPTMLVPFAIHNILRLATYYGCRDQLVNLYNEKTWYECKQALKLLNHKKLNAPSLGIKLIDTHYYKEAIFSASNDGILCVRYFCDNAQDYNFSNMFVLTRVDF